MLDHAMDDSPDAFPRLVPRHAVRRFASRVARGVRCLVTELKRSRDPGHLARFERRVHSQNGEDGILAEIFRRIGTTDRTFVEFGIEDGAQCNTRHLLESGWQGVWIEGDPARAARARTLAGVRPCRVESAFLTRDNVAEVFARAGVPAALDLLSIDVDGNDYHLWEALAGYRARVVAIEYNASFLPGTRWVMPYDPAHVWDRSRHAGASLDSLVELGERLGYVLVGCNWTGVNAFFVQRALAEPFVRPGDVAYHYMSPKYRVRYFGHRPVDVKSLGQALAGWRRRLFGSRR